jgi:subtilisin family serine protease
MSIFLLSIGMASILVVSGFNGTYKAESELIKAIVIFDEDTYGTQNESYMLEKFEIIKKRNLSRILAVSCELPIELLQRIREHAGVSSVEVDQIVSAFDGPSQASSQVIPTGISRINANDAASSAGANVKVAVIDTGIDYLHPDLEHNYMGGYDFVNDDPLPMDDNGHGTHVAGTIAAEDNGFGVIGVAPQAELYGVKVLDHEGSGWNSDVIAGILWAADNDMDVANLSLGMEGNSQAMQQAIEDATKAGVTVVVAAGNDYDDANNYIPASYEEAITVSAIADFDGEPGGLSPQSYGFGGQRVEIADDAFASFSNYGSAVDLAAPGQDILSTWPGGNYETISGTSMASPHVAGAAALYIASRSDNPPTPYEVAEALIQNATPQTNPDGFTDDPDSYAEPLLNVKTTSTPTATPTTTPTPESGGGGTSSGIIVGVIAAVVVVAIIAFFMVRSRKGKD